MAVGDKYKRKAATQQSTPTSQQVKKQKAGGHGAEDVVPRPQVGSPKPEETKGETDAEELELSTQEMDTANVIPGPDQVELPEQGGSATTRNLIAKPWGVDPPETAPTLPTADASLSHADALKYVKEIAAYVVAKLPKFFNDHKQDFLAFGFEVNDDMHPSAYDALALPSSVAALVLVGWFRWWIVRCGIDDTSQVFHLCKSGCSGILKGGGLEVMLGFGITTMAKVCH